MKIVTDCAADMSAEELDRLDVTQAPLFTQFPEGEMNSADISAEIVKEDNPPPYSIFLG